MEINEHLEAIHELINRILVYHYEIKREIEIIEASRAKVLINLAEFRRFQKTFDKSIGHLKKVTVKKSSRRERIRFFFHRIIGGEKL